KLISGWKVLVISGSVIFFAACKSNNDYTKNPATDSETTPVNTDTTAANTPIKTDTSSMSTAPAPKQNATSKKKGKITVGSMSAKTSSGMKPDKNGVYEMAEVSPAYPGGHDALENYINDNINYPQTAIDNNAGGTVEVQFVVDANGSVSNAKVIGKKLDDELDKEAVRVVSAMPKWTPGKVKGKDVKAKMVLPITYKAED
ncbi:MAG TPA: energy transducer TonB, partial [Chitinophagaceae bacterium]